MVTVRIIEVLNSPYTDWFIKFKK